MKVIATKFNLVYHLNKIINRQLNPIVDKHLLQDLILDEATYLNDYVIAQCHYLLEFLEDTETFIKKHGKCWKDTRSYYRESRPAFHNKNNCKWLYSYFINITIPERLRNHKGAVKMIRNAPPEILEKEHFSKHCTKLCDRLNAAFQFDPPVTIDEFGRIEKVGGKKVEIENDINIIISKVEILHLKALQYLENNPHTIKYKQNNFRPPSYAEFLRDYPGLASNKQQLFLYHRTFNDLCYFRKYLLIPIERRIRYYILGKINKNIKFDSTILEILGFKPCSNCFKPYSGFHTIEERAKELIEY